MIGVLWPLEGMPTILRYLGSILPMTYPAQAMRAAMGRGIYMYVCIYNNIWYVCMYTIILSRWCSVCIMPKCNLKN